MKVALIYNAQFPVHLYGGTERVVWWLAKGLSQRGVQVVLGALSGSQCPYGTVVPLDFSRPLEPQLRAEGCDIHHFFFTPAEPTSVPTLATIGGNGKAGEVFHQNSVFVSGDHARRHGAECYVYNGIDPDDYLFSAEKDERLLFLAKAKWRVKNVQGAIRIARKARFPIDIVGGSKWFPRRGRAHWRGILGGRPKAELIARARGLLFPVLWDEPFGIALIEALISGTPVLGTPFGSLPELIHSEVGRLCSSEKEFIEAVPTLAGFSPHRCRDFAAAFFSLTQMVQNYFTLYERILQGEPLNEKIPCTSVSKGELKVLP